MWIYLERFIIRDSNIKVGEIRPVLSALMQDEKLADGQTDCGAERERQSD